MEDVVKNRRDALLGMIQSEFPQYHPLMAIARIAHGDGADLKLQFECHKTIAKYVEPELKSIEIKGGLDNTHNVRVSLFEPSVKPVLPDLAPDQAITHESADCRVLPGGAIIDGQAEVVNRVVDDLWKA